LTERFEDLSLPIEKLLDELMDGDIIVFQREDDGYASYDFPTAKEYFRYCTLSHLHRSDRSAQE
jgi:ubiquitin carboxyl-terminal hydrolase 7